ncbi:MAG: hypothetical protein ACYS7Y_36190, partial [Planctomycetota bacterium]
SSALFDCPANFIAEFHVTVEDTNAVTSHQRYVTADDYGVGFTIDVNRQIWLIEKPGGSYSDLWAGPTLNDAEHYRIRLEVTGSTAKLYIDDELKTTKTTSGNFTETGGIINHVLATNDIKIVTESNPKAPGLIVADGTGAYADEDIYWTDPSGSAFSIASGAAMLLTMTGWEMPSTLRMGLDDSLTSPVFGNAAWNCVGPDVQADAGSAPDVIDDLVSGVEWKLNWSNEGVRTGGGSVYPGFGNYRFSFSLKRVALLDLSSWVERDFAEEHYHEVAPVYDTEHYLDADFHYRVIFERQTPGLLQLRFRRVDDDNHIHAYVDTSGNLRVNEVLDAGLNEIGRVNGVFTATVTYQMDVVVLGESIKVYVDNVLKISTTSTYLLTQAGAAAGAALCNYAVRTDEWWAHPHPALGLAIERWIAPRAADIDTGMPPDLLIQTRKLELPAGAENYLFRGTSITSPYCYAAGWESTGEANCREYDGDTNPQRVYGGPGTVADEDDHMARIDGAYLEVFVNSVSIGSYGSAIYQEQQGANNYPTAAVAADAIEFWPPRPQLPFSL